jgi:hypothetical protein
MVSGESGAWWVGALWLRPASHVNGRTSVKDERAIERGPMKHHLPPQGPGRRQSRRALWAFLPLRACTLHGEPYARTLPQSVLMRGVSCMSV